MKIITALAGTALMAVCAGAQAQIMKCVGKDGRVEFATSCPQGTTEQITGVSSKPAAPPPAKDEKGASKGVDNGADKGASKATDKGADKGSAKGADKGAPKSLADREAESKKRQAEQQAAAAKSDKEAQDKANRQRACEGAQSNVAALKSRQRNFRVDPKTGERVVYEEADYVREQQLAQQQVADYCK